MIQDLVGGIGFLGVGAIMSNSEGGRLRGVGSGAAIWAVGAIGVACGLGYLKEGAFLLVLIFCVLNAFDWLDRRSK
jgi:putative Mg2+ transporter-C (MgtC) family protein